jgi:hypothetical protein
MQLFVQLHLAALPKDVGKEFGAGLVQMFFCTNSAPCCDVECEGWQPFAASHFLRLAQAPAPAQATPIPEPIAEAYFPAKLITGWREIEDYPHPWECADHGVDLEDSEYETLDRLAFDSQGDKLAGWPIWIQAVEYPNCRRCGQRMRMVFQIDSECNLPYMFGDCGRGHITQCPEHKHELAFGWACT